MTYEEAIKRIEIAQAKIAYDYPTDYAVAFEMAIEAMELQVAKKPVEVDERVGESYYWLGFMCPNCDNSVIGQPYRPNNCKHCGQKLDWSVE